ncbi:MAG: Crp/Fnr family transcriptional regulator [bacterium]
MSQSEKESALGLLKKARLFNGCTSQELADINNICQKTVFKKGETIFEAKSPAKNLYIVIEGVIDLRFEVTYLQSTEEITLDRKLTGEAFGWSALSKPHTYTLSAYAEKDAELFMIAAKDIKGLSENNNHLGYILMNNIAEIIAERFAAVQNIVIDIIQQNLRDKEL